MVNTGNKTIKKQRADMNHKKAVFVKSDQVITGTAWTCFPKPRSLETQSYNLTEGEMQNI